ncbi:MAG: BPSS1780 family membrane protein [bacterium]
MLDKNNPYAAPQADVTPPRSSMMPDNLDLLPEARRLSIGAGFSWLKEAWALMKPNLGIWVLILLAYIVFQIVMGMIPVAGGIISQLLGPVIMAGIFMAAKHVDLGGTVRFDFLFEGFKTKFAPLFGLGALMLGVYILVGILVGGGMAVSMSGVNFDPETGVMDTSAMFSPIMLLLMLVGFVFFVLIALAFAYATHLVALNDVPVFEAIKRSFKGSAKNILPLIVYMLMMMVIFFISAIPLLLGLLITLPLFFVTSYVSYKQIFLNH